MFHNMSSMNQISQIYHNDFGVSFHWRKENRVITNRVQLVFKETGFYFSEPELQQFSEIIQNTCSKMICRDCSRFSECHKFLLKTPLVEIDLAVCKNELLQIKDLVEGTLFQLRLEEYINGICKN